MHYKIVMQPSLQRCIAACAADRKCAHAQYRQQTRLCAMKSRVNNAVDDTLFDSVICSDKAPVSTTTTTLRPQTSSTNPPSTSTRASSSSTRSATRSSGASVTTTTSATRTTSTQASTTTSTDPTALTPQQTRCAFRAVSTTGTTKYLEITSGSRDGDFLYWRPRTNAGTATTFIWDTSIHSIIFASDGARTYSQPFSTSEIIRLKTATTQNGQITTARNADGQNVMVRRSDASNLSPWGLCETDLTLAGQMLIKYMPVNLDDGCTRVQLVMETK